MIFVVKDLVLCLFYLSFRRPLISQHPASNCFTGRKPEFSWGEGGASTPLLPWLHKCCLCVRLVRMLYFFLYTLDIGNFENWNEVITCKFKRSHTKHAWAFFSSLRLVQPHLSNHQHSCCSLQFVHQSARKCVIKQLNKQTLCIIIPIS